jgi:GntR family transcriptional regulator/MocR family aminotransferase
MLDIRLDPNLHGALPIYQQLVDQIEFLIKAGKLAHGSRLPSTRDLARQLGISRGAVVQAYPALCGRALCPSHVGRGTLVAAPDIGTAASAAADHAGKAGASRTASSAGAGPSAYLLAPDEPLFDDPRSLALLPSLTDTSHLPVGELRQSFNRVLRYPALLNTFRESAGDLTLRKLICERVLPTRGIEAGPEQVIVVPGSQYGAMLIALSLQESRRALHFGVPGYLGIPRNFARFGYELHGHAVDADGIRLGAARLGGDDLLYVMPEHHFPQCISLSDERRGQLLRLAAARDLLIIEDDYDSEFYYDRQPQPALKAVAAAHSVIYLGTFSKVLFNSVRLGYMVADAERIREMAALHWSLSRGTSGLMQRWVAELIACGALERHVGRMRSVYRRKRDSVAAVLKKTFPEWKFRNPGGGLQFFIALESSAEVRRVLAACDRTNLAIGAPWSYTTDDARSEPFIVVGFGAMPFARIQSALGELRRAL